VTVTRIEGTVAVGFEKVADAFDQNFRQRGDTGAACAVYSGGVPVVDLWAGEAKGRPWTRDTRSVVFSVSKGVTTICLLMAVEAGFIDLDAPMASYWPEFAAHGKARLTVRQVLAHRAGLIVADDDLTLADLRAWQPVADALARQAPLWEPGTTHAYHAMTIGWLAGEVLRRATGRRPSEWLRANVAGPLGLTMSFGVAADTPGFAPIEAPLPSEDLAAAEALAAALDSPLLTRAIDLGVFDAADLFAMANTPAFLSCELPAANLVSSAHSLARLYAATVSQVYGVRLLGPDVVRDARVPLSEGTPYLGPDAGNRWGTGFMLDSPNRIMAGPGSFGHDGAGGQLGFAHLEAQIGFGYQTIRPGGLPDDRAEALCRALLACL
jgi:CubicO group peptidase (beta-lactamase class C family)